MSLSWKAVDRQKRGGDSVALAVKQHLLETLDTREGGEEIVNTEGHTWAIYPLSSTNLTPP